MAVAQDARAPAKVAFLELVDHLGQAARRHDVPRVNEAVEVAGGFLDRLAHVVVAVEVEDVGDQVQRMLVVVYLGVETREVEAVGYVFFVDFAKVFVSSRRYELWMAGLVSFGYGRNTTEAVQKARRKMKRRLVKTQQKT